MPFPLLGTLLGLGGGGILGLTKAAAAKKQAQVQGATTRYSPWTGMQAPAPDKVNMFGDMLQGGLSGAAFQQGLGANSGGSGVSDSNFGPLSNGQEYGGYLARHASPWMNIGPIASGNAYARMLSSLEE